MYGNGVRTGKEVIAAVHRLIQKVQAVGLYACFAVAAGSSSPGPVAWLFAAAARPTTGTATLASALPSPSYDLLPPAHSLVLSQRTEMLRKGGQKERRGTSLGKALPNDNIEEKMGIPAKPVAELWEKEHISRTGIAQKRTVIEKKARSGDISHKSLHSKTIYIW